VASRDAQRKVKQDEARWRRDMEASAKDARVREAKEQQRKADLFGAEHVYRTTPHAPLVAAVPRRGEVWQRRPVVSVSFMMHECTVCSPSHKRKRISQQVSRPARDAV